MGTVVCEVCGHSNGSDAAFCASCQSFLSWDAEAEASRTGRSDAAGSSSAEPAAPPAAPAPAASGRAPVPPARKQPGRDGDRSDTREDDTREDDTVTLPSSVAASTAAARAGERDDTLVLSERPVIAARQPERARTRPVPVPAADAPPVVRTPTARVCERCATSNGAERRFCRKCGASLVQGVPERTVRAAPVPPWWRRLVPGSDRPGRAARVAYRRTLPLRYRLRRTLLSALGLGAVLGLLAVAGRDPVGSVRGAYHDLRGTLVAVPRVTATTDPTAAPGIAPPTVVGDPAAVVDRNPATAWSTAWPLEAATGDCGSAPGAAVVLALGDVTEVRALRITAGLADDDPDRPSQRRPASIELRTLEGACVRLPVADHGRGQVVELPEPVTSTGLRLAVAAVHGTSTPSDQVTLREVAVLRRPL